MIKQNLCLFALVGLLLFYLPARAQGDGALHSREHLNFDADWRFHLGDPADITAGQLDYGNLKDFMLATGNDLSRKAPVTFPTGDPGANVSFIKPDFDDSSWRQLNLPHDWAIESGFDISLPGETGKLKYWGQGWYRKHFTLPATDQGRFIFLDIDGAMSYSSVWVNGHIAGGWAYGYSSYEIDLTPFLHFDGTDNVIAIRLNNPADSSRWYPGAGIYRNVWLTTTAPVHVAHWGTYVTTPQISPASATVALTTTVQNQSSADAQASVRTQIYELDGNDRRGIAAVATIASASNTVPAGKTLTFTGQTEVTNPKLWDLTHPHRYLAVTTVALNGTAADQYETRFGIRTTTFTVDQGLLLNGKHVPINGVCDHHDLGAIGTAFNLRAAERQLQILKEMGANAVRTAHNMPAPELLDLCDKMGVLVMDESFDCWRNGKKGHDYSGLFDDWHERDLRAELRRDRNHPSIIIWSMGNEIPEQGTPDAVATLADLAGIAHEEDTTRVVGQGTNHAEGFDPAFVKLFDAVGVNYDPEMYPGFRQKYPDMPMFSSESSSTCSSRGVYFFPPSDNQANFQVSSYDTMYPGWATSPWEQFKCLEKNPFVAGEFVWSGFDYIGEPTPYNSDMTNLLNFRGDPVKQAKMAEELKQLGKIPDPARSSYFGIVDLCGFKKDRFFLYQAHWRPDLPMIHLLPHWNWSGREGQKTPVYAYTSGDEAELFLNGTSLGRKKPEPYDYRIKWDDVTYAPGVLKAVAYKDGKPWAETTVQTTGEAAAVKLEPDRTTIRSDGLDLCYVTTTIVDAKGMTVPTAQNKVNFAISSGPGEIVATDNGDPTDLNNFNNADRNAFNGKALAIVRVKAGQKGDIHLSATSDGLASTDCVIHPR